MPNYIGDMLNAYDTQYQNRQNRQMNDMKIQQAQGEASQRAQQMEDEKLIRANAKKPWRETPMLVGLHDMLLNELDPTDTVGKQKLDSFWTDNRTAETIGQLLPIHQQDMKSHIERNQTVQAPVFENGQYVTKPVKAYELPTIKANQPIMQNKWEEELEVNYPVINPTTLDIEMKPTKRKDIPTITELNKFYFDKLNAKQQTDLVEKTKQLSDENANKKHIVYVIGKTGYPETLKDESGNEIQLSDNDLKYFNPQMLNQQRYQNTTENTVPVTINGTTYYVPPSKAAELALEQQGQSMKGVGSGKGGGVGGDNTPTITIQENGVWKTIVNPNYKPPTQALPVVTTQTPEVNPIANVNYDMPNPDMNRIGTSTEDDAFIYSTSPQRPVEVNNVPPATVTPANVPNTAITQPTLGAVQGMGSVKEQTDTIGVAGNQAYLKNPAIAKINPTESLRLLMDKDPVLKERYNQYSSLPETQGLPDDYVAVPVLLGGLTSFEIIPRKDKTLITNMIKEWNDNRKIPIYKNGKVVRYGQYSPAELRQKQIDEGKASANTLAFNRDMIKLKEGNKGRIALKGTPSYSDLHPAKPAPAKPKAVKNDAIGAFGANYETLNNNLFKLGNYWWEGTKTPEAIGDIKTTYVLPKRADLMIASILASIDNSADAKKIYANEVAKIESSNEEYYAREAKKLRLREYVDKAITLKTTGKTAKQYLKDKGY